MISFREKLVEKKLLDEICSSYEKGEKRDLVADCRRFIKENRVDFSVNYARPNLADIPTIVISNHYCRPLLVRKSFLTTVDSMVTSSIITTCLAKITQRRTTWVVKDDLIKNVLLYDSRPRRAQIATIVTYNFIGVGANYPFGGWHTWLTMLKSGYNVACYPEGKISTNFKNARVGFGETLEFLASSGLKFQILASSVWYQDNKFRLTFGKPIKFTSQSAKEIVKIAMDSIAQNLPKGLKGSKALI